MSEDHQGLGKTSPRGTWKSAIKLLRSILRARKVGLLRLRPAHSSDSLRCLREECPRHCCWAFDTVVVDQEDLKTLPRKGVRTRGLLQLRQRPYPSPTCSACYFLERGSCTIYSKRPSACREYPWYRFGDKLFVDRGCPGISEDSAGERPDPTTLQDASRYFSEIPFPLRRIVLWALKNI